MMKQCKATNCFKKAHARGLCSTHLSRLIRGANIDAPIRLVSKRKSEYCSVENCNRPYYCKDMCHFHYKRMIDSVDLNRQYHGYQRGKLEKNCLQCSKKFSVKKSLPNSKFCSKHCWGKHRIGEKNSNWRGGITDSTTEERNRFNRELREIILTRDNYICQICQSENSGNLQIDHIKSWAKYPELRFDINNCRTVCRPCHFYVTYKHKISPNSKWGLLCKSVLNK